MSWLFVGAMFVLCGILGVLQYRWLGEVSVAERDHLQQRLQTDLNHLSQEFNADLTSACRTLAQPGVPDGATVAAADLPDRYALLRKTPGHALFFTSIALATPHNDQLTLQRLDLTTGKMQEVAWPPEWKNLEDRLLSRLPPYRFHDRPLGQRAQLDAHLFEIPLFGRHSGEGPRGPFGRVESGWLILDLDMHYVRDVLLPQLVQDGIDTSAYYVDIRSKGSSPELIYQSRPNAVKEIGSHADASVGLFDIPIDQIFPRPEPPGGRSAFFPSPNFHASPDAGRWQLNVRNRAGSLEAVVASTRRRSIAVTGAILLLLVASAGALLSFTRRAQRLARLQMDFVAGISHELRTPLAVIHGAAYNLRGAVAQNPAQVEKYGVLLQQESGRLRDLVAQVLRFASAEAGNVIREPEPLSIHDLIDQTMESTRSVTQNAQCVVEKNVDPTLPIVLGDPIALKHALQNLVTNAAKYGQTGNNGGNWIGVAASPVTAKNNLAVEIRVADHGPGIPPDEQDHVFDAFFRGRRAIQDQIHGTGLGLNLVKKIIEAHGGSIRVESEPMKRTEFIIRLPATANTGVTE
jgi:signal transduction histidine kinase